MPKFTPVARPPLEQIYGRYEGELDRGPKGERFLIGGVFEPGPAGDENLRLTVEINLPNESWVQSPNAGSWWKLDARMPADGSFDGTFFQGMRQGPPQPGDEWKLALRIEAHWADGGFNVPSFVGRLELSKERIEQFINPFGSERTHIINWRDFALLRRGDA